MKTMKKALSMLLAATFVLSAFTGCTEKQEEPKATSTSPTSQQETPSNFNETGYPIVNEPITLSVMGSKAPIQGEWADMELFKEMEKLTGIKLTFTTHPSENYQELKNLAFVSGNLPDIFYGGSLTLSDEVTYGAQGVLLPLNDLVDKYAPNLKTLMGEDPELKKNITTTSGNIYSLPLINNVIWDMTTKLWINEEWVKNVGKEMPQTTDELYDVLKAFKDGDPNKDGVKDEVPMSFDTTTIDLLKTCMLANFGITNDDNNVSVNDDKVSYNMTSEKYKAYLQYMNKLYKENLLDNECFTQTNQQLVAKGNEMKVGMFSHAGAFLVVPYDQKEKYPALAPLTSPVHDKAVWTKYSNLNRGAFAITNKCENPETAMRWVDYFYTVEGGKMMSQGPEGLAWKWTDDDKSQWEKVTPEGYANSEEYRGGKISPNCGTSTPGYFSSEFMGKLKAEHVPILLNNTEEKYVPVWKTAYPLVYFTEEQQDRLTILTADIKTYVDQMHAKFVTGEAKLDTWESYITTIEKMGLTELLEIYQAAYDAWNK